MNIASGQDDNKTGDESKCLLRWNFMDRVAASFPRTLAYCDKGILENKKCDLRNPAQYNATDGADNIPSRTN
ncbi:hypothetical protein CHS0354_021152 [Potamilus streckersoni]|uniref:Uncharacterized protein n=1 Tax=Potamilus streckersoni TaxID=2493646 RepID=A0AAE0W585_9BIVA|nr:hypothetical protein CHS0354_021152 [Potamilus streckersoni]